MATEKEVPIFKVTQAPGFMTGIRVYAVGEEIPWEEPEGWNEAKYGKHFSKFGPSTTFEPMNDAARERMSDHHDMIKEKAKPAPTAQDERAEKMEALQLQMLQAQLETQALLRRLVEKGLEAEEEEVDEVVDGVKVKVKKPKKK